jgi:hypothetical protein
LFPQDFARAAQLFRIAADAGNADAQYALATFYKEGRGVAKDLNEAARLLEAASLADHLEAQVEYAIVLFNGTGVTKNEQAAIALFRKAARRGSPVAQNRLARILAAGLGTTADPVEAVKWHLISKKGGVTDLWLDDFVGKLTPEQREAGEKAAQPWLNARSQDRS